MTIVSRHPKIEDFLAWNKFPTEYQLLVKINKLVAEAKLKGLTVLEVEAALTTAHRQAVHNTKMAGGPVNEQRAN